MRLLVVIVHLLPVSSETYINNTVKAYPAVCLGQGYEFLIYPDMADSCQQMTLFPPIAFLWFGFNMIPGQCQRRNLCCDG